MSRIVAIMAVAFLGFTGAAPAAESPGERALQARTILKKYCAECHDSPAAKGTVKILDMSSLVNLNRKLPPFVKPKAASASQIVEFIEDGSMPPGIRPKVSPEEAAIVRAWIEGGAPAFPRQFDESFANAAILADIESVMAVERKFMRYLSLHHLLEGAAPVDLAKSREALRKAINSVSKKEIEALKPIDPTETIFRLDVREIGWEANEFRHVQPGKPPLQVTFNIFDFLLLEYPFGEMPPATPDAERLADLWLRTAGMVRPITHVRGDWFVKALDGTPLKTDISRLIGGGARGRGFAPEKKGLDLKPEDLPQIVIRPLATAIPIVPIDAWYSGNYEPKAPAPSIELVFKNAGQVTTRFKPGDKLQLEIKSNETVFVELIQIDPEGSIFVHGTKDRIKQDEVKDYPFEGKNEGLTIGDLMGKNRFIVFAAKDPFPEGELLQSKHEELPIERLVHRFYELPKKIGDPPPRFDPSKMVRKTVIIEVGK